MYGHFGVTCYLHLLLRREPRKQQASNTAHSLALKMEAVYSLETSVTFTKLHGITFQKKALFIVTAVRNSDLIQHFVRRSFMYEALPLYPPNYLWL
jgi:hypothetical protein